MTLGHRIPPPERSVLAAHRCRTSGVTSSVGSKFGRCVIRIVKMTIFGGSSRLFLQRRVYLTGRHAVFAAPSDVFGIAQGVFI